MGYILAISGWTVDSACAVAIALNRYPDAEIVAMSRSGLPVMLDDISRNRADVYSQILIFGIPLVSERQNLLLSALSRLRRGKVRVSWFCSYPLNSPLPAEISKNIDSRIANAETQLARHVADELKISRRTGAIQNICKIARADGLDSAAKQREMLLEAGMSRFRRFREMRPFINAVKTISANRPLDSTDLRFIDEYQRFGHRELRGRSKTVGELQRLVKLVGNDNNCSVLIRGETGTGKGTVASLIHGHSDRQCEPFIEFNCAVMSPHLTESALFGHEKGAFTGADTRRAGAFEQAEAGTLFLDEIGDLPPQIQAGILQVVQEGRFRRLGGSEEIKCNVRIISATNRSLSDMIRKGEFREDLFYRLDVVHINIPPLRERKEDIEYIANDILIKRRQPKLSPADLDALLRHSWPGNVRELQNILERAIVLKTRDFCNLIATQAASSGFSAASESLRDAELAHVGLLYDKYSQNKTMTAKALGISVNTLKKYLAEMRT